MENIIWKELSEDDPIFKNGFVLSSENMQTGLNHTKNEIKVAIIAGEASGDLYGSNL